MRDKSFPTWFYFLHMHTMDAFGNCLDWVGTQRCWSLNYCSPSLSSYNDSRLTFLVNLDNFVCCWKVAYKNGCFLVTSTYVFEVFTSLLSLFPTILGRLPNKLDATKYQCSIRSDCLSNLLKSATWATRYPLDWLSNNFWLPLTTMVTHPLTDRIKRSLTSDLA